MAKRAFLAGAAMALALTACQDQFAGGGSTRHLAPIPPATMSLMSTKGMQKSDPILIRAYKKESEMEVWKRGQDGKYALLKTYPICRWSGQLGPKIREGDRQAPEGFYSVTPAQMNPNSAYYLSFDTGYPNAYDRAHGRTGSALMVHGTCSSRGCFAMTDEAIAEVYALAREAFSGGQRAFQFQSYPFRMTAENLAKHRADPHIGFWKNLKAGSDHFETLKEEPRVAVCGRSYAFGSADGADCSPQVDPLVAEKRERDEKAVAELVAKGTPAVRVVYEDGGQHASFRQALAMAGGGETSSSFLVLDTRPRMGVVSRPEALAEGPREIAVEADRPAGKPSVTALASAAPAKAGAAKTQATSLAEARKPAAPEKPRPIMVASAGEDGAALGKISSRLGGAKEAPAAKAPPPAPAALAAKPRPLVTMKPSAASAQAKPAQAGASPAVAAAKPAQAAAAKPKAGAAGSPAAERRAELLPVIRGAQAPVPSTFAGIAQAR